MNKKIHANRLDGLEENIWEEIYRMRLKNKPVNLGSGSPDYTAQPKSLIDALVDVTLNGDFTVNQYTSGYGHPRLVKILSKLYTKLLSQNVDENNILVTSGAYGALYCSITGIINPGDEVIIIDPHFDSYTPAVLMAEGIPVYISLKQNIDKLSIDSSNDFVLDFAELEEKFNVKTKMIIINTPHNPLGKVFSESELRKISELCIKYNVIALMDEVYEWITYDNYQHFRLASISGMFEKSITIGSISKSLSVTGWRCGWALTANQDIRNAIYLVQQNNYYSAPTNIQEATARAFEMEFDKILSNKQNETYFYELSKQLVEKRELMFNLLSGFGLQPIRPIGGYFMVADCQQLVKKIDLTEFDSKRGISFQLIEWLSTNKIQAIPMTMFYSKNNQCFGENHIRFCFFKCNETFSKAEQNFNELKLKFNL